VSNSRITSPDLKRAMIIDEKAVEHGNVAPVARSGIVEEFLKA
jgi:hypothetical protein